MVKKRSRRSQKESRRKSDPSEKKMVQTLEQIKDLMMVNQQRQSNGIKLTVPRVISAKKVYSFHRSAPSNIVTVSTSGSTPVALAFILITFDPTSEIQNTYQFYRITHFYALFKPVQPPIADSVSADWGTFHLAVDFIDATTPASAAELEQYSTWQSCSTRMPIDVDWAPRTRALIEGSGGNRYAAMSNKTWLSTRVAADAKYYGLKYITTQATGIPASGMAVYDCYISADIECKHPI